MRYLMIMAMALGALAIPSSAFATHGGNNRDCPPQPGKTHTRVSMAGKTVDVYYNTQPPYLIKVGGCVDLNGNKTAGPIRFDGGTVEAGAGEDPAGGAGDPGLVPNQPDAYAVVDGDDDNVDPQGQSDGYVGVSNWENSVPGDRTTQAECTGSGPDNGAVGSSNSGGCLGVDNGPWVYVPGDLPTPVCGNTSGNAWDGSGSQGQHNRDGCQIP